MKGLLTTIFCILLATSYGQTIVLNNYPKTVPNGKKWVLPTGKRILIEVANGALRPGSMCNALILSNPKIVKGIVEGNYGRPNEVYAILFNDLDKVAYTNNYTFSILPVSIIDSKFSLYELQFKNIEEVGSKEIAFFPGQKLFVGECLQSLQLYEVNLTVKELSDIKKKEQEANKVELKKIQEEESIKLKSEQERREKIVNSSYFFYSNQLSNGKELKLSVQKDALSIFYEYLIEFKNQHRSSFDAKIAYYNRIVSNSEKNKYSMFNFSFYFDKQGNFKKITQNSVFVKGEGSKDIDFDSVWFNKLKPLISLNTSGSIKLDDKDYNVNSYYPVFFNFYENLSNSNAQITINKKGGIIILLNNTKFSNEKLIEMIKSNVKFTDLSRGKYSVTVATEKLSLQLSHFQNYDNKEIVTFQNETYSVLSVDKL